MFYDGNGCFSVYTQQKHSPDFRSFIYCFISKLHLMFSWAHLNTDKLIAWEFFHPACTTSARSLDGSSMEMKTINIKYCLLSHQFNHVIWSFKSFDIMYVFISPNVGISCRCRCMYKLLGKIVKVASLWFFQPLYLSLYTLVSMGFTSIHFYQCFITINILNTTIITGSHISGPPNVIEQCIYFVHLQETYHKVLCEKEYANI